MSNRPAVEPVPVGRTARRLEWQFLPPHIRTLIADRCGSPVVSAGSQGGGFTPGFASVLTCEDGSKHFVKAASVKAQRMFAESYREEFRKLGDLPEGVPAPRLLWVHESDWVVLGIEYVESRAPRRPWTAKDLAATLDALETVAERLTPAPEGMELDPFSDEFGEMVSHWDHVRTVTPDLPAPRGRRRAGRPLRRGHRGRHARAHRRPRRQRAPRPRRSGAGSATGTGRSAAPPGSTPSSS